MIYEPVSRLTTTPENSHLRHRSSRQYPGKQKIIRLLHFLTFPFWITGKACSPSNARAVFAVSNCKLAPENTHPIGNSPSIWLPKNLTGVFRSDAIVRFVPFPCHPPEFPHLYPFGSGFPPKFTSRFIPSFPSPSRKDSPQRFRTPKTGHFGRRALKTLTFACRSVPLCLTTRLFRLENRAKQGVDACPAAPHPYFSTFSRCYSGPYRRSGRSAPEESHLSE